MLLHRCGLICCIKDLVSRWPLSLISSRQNFTTTSSTTSKNISVHTVCAGADHTRRNRIVLSSAYSPQNKLWIVEASDPRPEAFSRRRNCLGFIRNFANNGIARHASTRFPIGLGKGGQPPCAPVMLEILFQFLSTMDVLGSINLIESMPRLDRCLTMLLVYCHRINIRHVGWSWSTCDFAASQVESLFLRTLWFPELFCFSLSALTMGMSWQRPPWCIFMNSNSFYPSPSTGSYQYNYSFCWVLFSTAMAISDTVQTLSAAFSLSVGIVLSTMIFSANEFG